MLLINTVSTQAPYSQPKPTPYVLTPEMRDLVLRVIAGEFEYLTPMQWKRLRMTEAKRTRKSNNKGKKKSKRKGKR